MSLVNQRRPLQPPQQFHELAFQQFAACCAQLTRFDVLIKQRFQSQQIPMQSRTTQRWGEVIDDHRLTPSLGLRPLSGIIDDEGIDIGDGSQGQRRRTGRTQANGFAR